MTELALAGRHSFRAAHRHVTRGPEPTDSLLAAHRCLSGPYPAKRVLGCGPKQRRLASVMLPLVLSLALTSCDHKSTVVIHGRIEEPTFCPAPGSSEQQIFLGRLRVTIEDASGEVLAATLTGKTQLDAARSDSKAGNRWAFSVFALSVERTPFYRIAIGPGMNPVPGVSYVKLKAQGFRLTVVASTAP